MVLELIADGVHLHSALTVALLTGMPGRVALISDAMAAAGCPDGRYRLGGQEVAVHDGVARLAGSDTLAGATSLLGDAVQRLVAAGADLALAVRAATLTPARYLGLDGVGVLAAGARADVLVMSTDGRVQRVMVGGRWLPADEPVG